MNNIHEAAGKVGYVTEQVEMANGYYLRQRQAIKEKGTIIELKGVAQTLWDKQSSFVRGITDTMPTIPRANRHRPRSRANPLPPPQKPPKVKVVTRQAAFLPAPCTAKPISTYLNRIHEKLEAQLANLDEIQLK